MTQSRWGFYERGQLLAGARTSEAEEPFPQKSGHMFLGLRERHYGSRAASQRAQGAKALHRRVQAFGGRSLDQQQQDGVTNSARVWCQFLESAGLEKAVWPRS